MDYRHMIAVFIFPILAFAQVGEPSSGRTGQVNPYHRDWFECSFNYFRDLYSAVNNPDRNLDSNATWENSRRLSQQFLPIKYRRRSPTPMPAEPNANGPTDSPQWGAPNRGQLGVPGGPIAPSPRHPNGEGLGPGDNDDGDDDDGFGAGPNGYAPTPQQGGYFLPPYVVLALKNLKEEEFGLFRKCLKAGKAVGKFDSNFIMLEKLRTIATVLDAVESNWANGKIEEGQRTIGRIQRKYNPGAPGFVGSASPQEAPGTPPTPNHQQPNIGR